MVDNTVTIVGNLTADPEIRVTDGGATLAEICLLSVPVLLKLRAPADLSSSTQFLSCAKSALKWLVSSIPSITTPPFL